MKHKLYEHPIFAISVYSTILSGTYDSQIIESVENLSKDSKGRQVSNRGGWQSELYDNTMYDSPGIFNIFETEITPIARKIWKEWGMPFEGKNLCYWYNINRKYNFNALHNHPNSYMSGVYYLKVPKNSGNIVFRRCEAEADRMHFLSTELEKFSTSVDNKHINNLHWVPPEPSKLILFPGHLNHEVEQNLTEDEDDRRISFSFNYFLRT